MGNMSYCRFTNTLEDLRDCYEAMGDSYEMDDLNEEESRNRWRLIRLCMDIAGDYGDEWEDYDEKRQAARKAAAASSKEAE